MYSFECEGCGKRFEELVAYSRREEVACPDCGGKTKVLVASFAAKLGGGIASTGSAPAPARPRFS